MTKTNRHTQLEAIVLHKRPQPNGDVILTVFDRYNGKLKALAKKVLLPTSHRSGRLETGFYILAHAHKKPNSNLYTLGRIEQYESFWDILIDLDRAAWFFRVLDLVNKTIPDNYPHPDLFDNLVDLFLALDLYIFTNDQPNYELIQLTFHAFEAKLLYHLGYWPKEKIRHKKWQKVIHFLLHKTPSEILSLNFSRSHTNFINQLQTFLDQLHQNLIEYQPISPSFFNKLKIKQSHDQD